jgi:hypothetical protein
MIQAGLAAVKGLSDVLATLQSGGEVTPEQMALVKAEQAAAQARLEAAIDARLGGATPQM